ncbi:VPLPA-CTERM sorting domain-containing protein [bacterium]|nr:VPLPA-CTERM sorting domain-containing protein [bacterium]
MFNGDSGTYHYWDGSYSGSGDPAVDHSALSGGTGDLTDGVIATQNWFDAENSAGTGPYVGWRDYNPTISFFFDSLVKFTSMTFHFDDSNNGGVQQPSAVSANGISASVPDNPGTAPFAFTLDLTGLSPTSLLTVDITRIDRWVFLSEVTFDGQVSAVPLPAGGLLLLGALGSLAALRRRSKTAA